MTCLAVCVCVCVCVRPFTVKASSVWSSWDCQGTDQRLLCRFPSSLLWNVESNLSASCFILLVHQKQAQPRLNQYTSRLQNIGSLFTINRRRLQYALHREPICFCVSTHERVHNPSRKATNFSIESSFWQSTQPSPSSFISVSENVIFHLRRRNSRLLKTGKKRQDKMLLHEKMI